MMPFLAYYLSYRPLSSSGKGKHCFDVIIDCRALYCLVREVGTINKESKGNGTPKGFLTYSLLFF